MKDLRVRVLGEFCVDGFDGAALGSRKARRLLKALAIRNGEPLAIHEAIDVIWGDAPPRTPADQVAVLVSRLRGVLGANRLTRSAAGYSLVIDWLDLAAARALCMEAELRLHDDRLVAARTALAAALTLFRGELLADEPDALWCESERESAARLLLSLRRLGAEAAYRAGDHRAALDLCESILESDPYDEVGLRGAMTALAATGRGASALALYETFRARLVDSLGVSPSSITGDLHVVLLKAQGSETQGVPPRPQQAVAELPGRGDILRALTAAHVAAGTGSGGIVEVVGEQGMGKTRVLREWAGGVVASGGLVLSGACRAGARGLPLQPILDALNDHLRSVAPEFVAELLGDEAATLGPLLGVAVGWTVPDLRMSQTVIHSAIVRLLSRLGGGATVTLVLDDLQFADNATTDWVHNCAPLASHLPILVVTARWPKVTAAVHGALQMELTPLDLTAVTAIVGGDRAADLLQRSGGNPLFLTELEASSPDEIPASISDAVTRRCELAGEAAATLRTAAVIGSVVDLDVLAAVLRAPAITLLDHLEVGVRLLILDERGPEFVFRHELVREALARGTSSARQALVHREAGRELVARESLDVIEIADHSRRGGDTAAAASALLLASSTALERHAYVDAEAYAAQAVTLDPTPAAHVQRSRALLLLGRFADAEAEGEAAIAGGGGVTAYETAAAASYYCRRLRRSTELAEAGLTSAVSSSERLGCLVASGRSHHALGDIVVASARLEEAMTIADELSRPPPTAALVFVRVHQGRTAEAIELARRGGGVSHAFAAYTPVHGPFGVGYALATAGHAAEALDAFERADEEARLYGIERYTGLAANFRGWVLRQLGAMDEADRCSSRCRLWAQGVGYAEAEAYSILDLAEGRLHAGEVAAARVLLDVVTPLLDEEYAYAWRNRMRFKLLLVRIALHEHRVDAAVTLALEVGDAADHFAAPRYGAQAALWGEVGRAQGGGRIDHNLCVAAVETLEHVAGLEAWWLAGLLAGATGSSRWGKRAIELVDILAERAGRHGPGFRRYAAARLESMSTADTRG
jgi:DNA-binding SARP family transcriptional activator/tetratricopeptide (TPR) repeat protein